MTGVGIGGTSHGFKFTFVEAIRNERSFNVRSFLSQATALANDLRSRFRPGTAVGLVFRSEPILVVAWLACLHAGLRPLIMQYPTKKQSRLYWLDSVSNAISRAELGAVFCDEYCASLGVKQLVEAVVLPAFEAMPPAERGVPDSLLPESFSILQLSSGTTGFRKAIEFRAEDLRRHVADFNLVLNLDPQRDRIVSWLPLYHDMGYVACFVMPLILGIDVVMMDPMTWIQDPELLFHAIEKYSCTIAYLPNFGYEILARAKARSCPTMRRWISCSEPVSASTSYRFIKSVGADETAFAPCYAMAENIFAISLGQGIRCVSIEGRDVVSCGRLIPSVEIKTVDGELWVRSPTSLRNYIGGSDIQDLDGFYPTGDLGQIIDGEVYVTGRKQDLLVQAGRKFMLSDIDLAVNEAFPEVKGRIAAVQLDDERLGTQKPVVLIEAQDFFLRKDRQVVAEAIRDTVGLDYVEVDFVPPRFLTKTSSGKINRKKSAQDWLACRAAAGSSEAVAASVEDELLRSFGHLDWKAPVGKLLDSLSSTVLRIMLSEAGIAYDKKRSLAEFALESKTQNGEGGAETIYIVSLADCGSLRYIKPKHVERLSRLLGAPVVIEHICLPPSPIILSDLVFQDWFLPRAERTDYAAIDRQLNKLRRASIILVDDVAEMLFPPAQVYSALSHAFERDPRSDLISVRWQRYPQLHHKLPVTVVSGNDLPLAERTEALAMLSAYLGTPIFRMSFMRAVSHFTEGWEFRAYSESDNSRRPRLYAQPAVLFNELAKWVKRLPKPLKRQTMTGKAVLEMSDLAHFCSRIMDEKVIEKILARFDRFCIVGQESSVPFLSRRIAELGKSHVRAPSYAPDILEPINNKFDAILVCGPQGRYPLTKPTFALMASNPGANTWNVNDPELTKLDFTVPTARAPASSKDWYFTGQLVRGRDDEEFAALREAIREFRNRDRTALERRRPARPSGRAQMQRVRVR